MNCNHCQRYSLPLQSIACAMTSAKLPPLERRVSVECAVTLAQTKMLALEAALSK